MSERDDPVIGHLKRFPAQMSRFEDMLGYVAADARRVKQPVAGFMTSEMNQDAEVAALKLRLERIERRLDLVD